MIRRMHVDPIKVQIWCQVYLYASYIPIALRRAVQVVSFGSTNLIVKGASIKVDAQSMFPEDRPGIGTFDTVLGQVSRHYAPHLAKRVTAFMKDSNVLFRGWFSRAQWKPRRQLADDLKQIPAVSLITPKGEILVWS
mmetsp:Transcript_570/g.931  ORF Transcript_570/g.931 Transcript_570/m.931 type:complete len:137 (-) Transcript_570:216-626(-)